MPNSPLDLLTGPYAVAVHDAGAANMIAAWVAAAKSPPALVIADGPAKTIWRRRFGQNVALSEDPEALDSVACLISGTGWASDLEHRARRAATVIGVRSIAVIDHWVNYEMRFEREGIVQLPDAIWVGDGDAEAIARDAFATTAIEQHPNLYLAQQARDAGPVPEDGDILFLLEPARSCWGANTPGEFQALDFFIKRRTRAGIAPGNPIWIRPHPSDPNGKYDEWLEANPSILLDNAPDLASSLARARFVAGMNSAGLVVALEAEREVICALPPNAPACVLPHKGIVRLADL